jgi:hypothetical protein
MESSRIFIVGSGVVGAATGEGFLAAGHKVTFIDVSAPRVAELAARGLDVRTEIDLAGEPESFIFLTLPTPNDRHRYDLSVGLASNPEFLRAASAAEDFANPWMQVNGPTMALSVVSQRSTPHDPFEVKVECPGGGAQPHLATIMLGRAGDFMVMSTPWVVVAPRTPPGSAGQRRPHPSDRRAKQLSSSPRRRRAADPAPGAAQRGIAARGPDPAGAERPARPAEEGSVTPSLTSTELQVGGSRP